MQKMYTENCVVNVKMKQVIRCQKAQIPACGLSFLNQPQYFLWWAHWQLTSSSESEAAALEQSCTDSCSKREATKTVPVRFEGEIAPSPRAEMSLVPWAMSLFAKTSANLQNTALITKTESLLPHNKRTMRKHEVGAKEKYQKRRTSRRSN